MLTIKICENRAETPATQKRRQTQNEEKKMNITKCMGMKKRVELNSNRIIKWIERNPPKIITLHLFKILPGYGDSISTWETTRKTVCCAWREYVWTQKQHNLLLPTRAPQQTTFLLRVELWIVGILNKPRMQIKFRKIIPNVMWREQKSIMRAYLKTQCTLNFCSDTQLVIM